MKNCSYCHKTFYKTEHLLRHERSHTGEKPYLCRKCGRRYARSDVLLRHVKYFHGRDSPPSEGRSTTTQEGAAEAPRRDSTTRDSQGPSSNSPNNESEIEVDDNKNIDVLPDAEAAPAHGHQPAEGHPQNLAPGHAAPANFDTPAAAPMMRPRDEGLNGLADAALHPLLQVHQDLHHPPPEPAATQEFVAPSMSAAPGDMVGGTPGFRPQEPMYSGSEFAPNSFMMGNPYPSDLQLYQGIFDIFNSSNPNNSNNHGGSNNSFHSPDFMNFSVESSFLSSVMSTRASSTERASNIPLERFATVARLWPNNRAYTAGENAANIWAEVVAYEGDNILTDTSIAKSSPAPSIGQENESKWGLDEAKRQDLIHEFASDLPSPAEGSNSSPGFPPTRLLNLGLDVAFRQPHSLLPFIHRPTFSAKSTPNLVVVSLCLLGLALLDSRQVRALASSYLPAVTRKCCHQLATPSFGKGGSAKLIASLTSATLLLKAWTICQPRGTEDELLARMLYNQTFSVAQLSGLFAARSSSPTIGELLDQFRTQGGAQAQPQGDDALWKAWARSESVKRLVAIMIATDAWWAYTLGEAPRIRTPAMQFEHPCSGELFQSSSSRLWKRLVDDGATIVPGSALIQTDGPSLHLTESWNVSPIGIVGLLSVIWIRILEVRPPAAAKPPPPPPPQPQPSAGDHHHHHQQPGGLGDAATAAVVQQQHKGVFASEDAGRALSHTLNDIYAAYARFLRFRDPNCVAMWHFLNLNLFADLQVFELAAGRNGAESAHDALQEITAWSQTWYARRACLHAAGIYAAMNRRRINDGTMFHSEVSVFVAALVLGLYVFMMASDGDEEGGGGDGDGGPRTRGAGADAEPYEFLNEVDWAALGGSGAAGAGDTVAGISLSSPFSPPSTTAPGGLPGAGGGGDGQESAARRFVREGGVVSFSGVICEGGYNAAKMILLEFASLLEEVGKWNAKGFCRILRIMSDSLLDLDDQMDSSSSSN